MSDTLTEQLDYYRERAAEYDQWWLRLGRYDRGPELNARWFAEAAEVAAGLSEFAPKGRILDLACGTGIWTEKLLPFARSPDGVAPPLVAVDGSPEMLALNAGRLRSPAVHYVCADLFDWQPKEQFDTVFFGFWLSHVPPERFTQFWNLVSNCLAPGGRIFFVDSRRDPTSTASDHQLPDPKATTLTRRLNDGREFQIYKIFYDPGALAQTLGSMNWHAELRQTANYFLYGWGRR